MARRKQSSSFLCECLADAYISFLNANLDDKITINEICEKAGVSRNTYFRNFKDKKELLSYKLCLLFSEWSKTNPITRGKERSFDRIYSFINLIYENKQFFKVLYNNEYKFLFYSFFTDNLLKQIIDTKDAYYSNAFIYSLLGILDVWMEKGIKESPQEIANIARDILNKPEINL